MGGSPRQATRKSQPALEVARVLVASDWAPIRAYDDIIRQDPEAVYGDLLPALRGADLRIVNCECALTTAGKPIWKSGSVFKGAPEHVGGLSVVPFEVACLANNHVFDYGLTGFRESLQILRSNGLKTVGAGLTAEEAWAPLTLTVKGQKIAIINISEGEDMMGAQDGPGVCGWDIERIALLVRDNKARGSCVIVIAHCGLEYIPYPPPYVAMVFRLLIEYGADCVIGHHPHVPQGIEFHQGRPIVYSLGNFVFYQQTDLHYRKIGFCAALEIAKNSLSRVEIYPYRITDAGLTKLPVRMEEQFHQKVKRISRPLNRPGGIENAWQAYLAYYGLNGFRNEVLGIVDKMTLETEKGAAMFRNRITTMQHFELWCGFLTRLIAGKKPPVSKDATAIIEEYFTRKTPA